MSHPEPAEGVSKILKPSEMIALQRRTIAEQQAIIDILKGALALVDGVEAFAEPQPWMRGLTRQERALVGALLAASPKAVPIWVLLEALPGHDALADRQAQLVAVNVCKIRKKLGRETIQNHWGEGYFISADQKSRLLAL